MSRKVVLHSYSFSVFHQSPTVLTMSESELVQYTRLTERGGKDGLGSGRTGSDDSHQSGSSGGSSALKDIAFGSVS